MNIILLPRFHQVGDRVKLSDRAHQHVQCHLKPKPGDLLRAGFLNHSMGSIRVLNLNDRSCEVEVIEVNSPPPPRIDLRVLIALQRPKSLRRIFKNFAQMGVKEIHLYHSYKVDKNFWRSELTEEESYVPWMIEGLEQAKDCVLPKVYKHRRFRPFFEDELPRFLEGGQGVVAHPYAEPFPSSLEQSVRTLVIGPEGGFVDFELDLMEQVGLKAWSFSPRTFSTEAFCTYVLGRLGF